MSGEPTLMRVTPYPSSSMLGVYWRNNDTYSEIYIYRKAGSGSYALVKTLTDGSSREWQNYGLSSNTTYTYKLRALIGKVYTDYSNEIARTMWSDTLTDTLVTTDTADHGGSESDEDTFFDSLTLVDTLSSAVTYADTFTETLTLSDLLIDGQISGPAFKYYIGRTDGDVCIFDTDYKGDAGQIITATYKTKVTDFSDQYYQFADNYKCVYSVKLLYEDLEEITVTVSVSTDGGATWTDSLATIGSGDGRSKAKEFFFIKHGQYFQFKIVHASASTSFKWLGLEVEFEPTGAYYSIT